ncbi:MAG: DNA gyrase subunit A [Dehalococcoidales bacterium]|nr:DNA gyrase subunit A [Dehalococcoidales bacterium]
MVLGKIRPVSIEDEMRSSYLDYAMSVIVSRALPDVRDGLKPVHRRILYAMNEMGMNSNTPYKKSARIVGEVLGKYHPHGDGPVYDAMVRMAQDFSMRAMLVDGQGNFGSVDNDPPAAMRYTEARLTAIAEQMMSDIDKETVDFNPNFDESLKEPVVLPARVPNLLVNGSSGIAVGMATNIPPHNLSEVCDAVAYLIDNPRATIDELTEFIKGPDFPTGGVILGEEGIKSAYATGRGRIVVRAKAYLGDASETGQRQIIITELPFQVNKAALVEKIASLVTSKKITGISELRDESDRQGMRVVIQLKREAQPQKLLNNLYKYTQLQTTFAANILALVDGQPRVLSLKEALQYFIDFRREVVTRRSRFELKKARSRAHILEGLKIALDNIDKVIATIRKSRTTEDARQNLMSEFSLSQVQADAILEMPLRRLATLERNKVLEEYTEVLKTISYLEGLLTNPGRLLGVVKEELEKLKTEFSDERRTEISTEGVAEFREEDLIPHQRVAVILSNRGFIKRVPTRAYRSTHRGAKGIIGITTREEDAVRLLAVADTHDNLLLLTNKGRCFSVKCYELPPDSSRVSKGTAVINLFSILEDEKVTDMAVVPEFTPDAFMVLVTRLGEVKKTALDKFAAVRSSGLIAMDVEDGDELVASLVATDREELVMVTENGQSIRFAISSIRASSRTSGGVRGIRLAAGDRVVGAGIAQPKTYLLIVTTQGFGKLTPIDDYPKQHRAGGGVRTFKIIEKTGGLADARLVTRSQEVMFISSNGIVVRTPVKDITVQGRSTQGVILMRMSEGDEVVALAHMDIA